MTAVLRAFCSSEMVGAGSCWRLVDLLRMASRLHLVYGLGLQLAERQLRQSVTGKTGPQWRGLAHQRLLIVGPRDVVGGQW